MPVTESSIPPAPKKAVKDHWESEPCGTRGMDPLERRRFFDQIEQERYALEPYIRTFARFEEGRGRRVLEVGVGAGTDFMQWVRAGAIATGVDLTETGVALTRERLELEGLVADVRTGDAEALPFPDSTFDLVYSYGVLHHSPDTSAAVREVHRVLRPGGVARVMIYNSTSWVALMMWLLHCLGKLRPWRSARWAASRFLESPGTKLFTAGEARDMFKQFARVSVRPQLGHGDLLLMRPGKRYAAWHARILWTIYPRWFVRLTGDRFGTALLIEAVK
jgi:ubiquinone/menaquinone biosynthesis C-methylase UbiE